MRTLTIMRGHDSQQASAAEPNEASAADALEETENGAGAAPETDSRAPGPGGPRGLVIGAVVAVLVVAAVVIYLVTQQEDRPEAQVPDPVTTTLPVPTPAGEPIEVDEATALSAALPEAVLDHVLTSQSEDEQAYDEHDALEGWHLTYTAPGSDIDLHVLQWESAEDAAAYVEDVLSDRYGFVDGQGRRSGDVVVDGEAVGRYEIGVLSEQDEPAEASTPADPGAEPVATPEPLGPGMAVWSNGTVALVATGEAARVAQFYDNFPF